MDKNLARSKVLDAMKDYVESAGVPISEFDPGFAVRMMDAMMVSFFKYGKLSKAYPLKFNAVEDIKARLKRYRETGDKHFLVDVANFAMIESIHASIESQWGENSAANSPGRVLASGKRLVQEDNEGNRISGETILRDNQ